ncbi:MAG TPA: CRISPR-associated endonuclease Cas2 [Candidatus Paceibacterota bacterium]
MGQLEKEARHQRRMGNIQRTILTTVALSGIIAVALITPNTLQLLGKIPKFKRQFMYRSNNIITQLARDGYVIFEEHKGKKYARISEAGKSALWVRGNMLLEQSMRPKRWDKHWRVVIFDIPEKKRAMRNALRTMMQRFGFYRLQDSVWVYPHDCEDVIALVKTELRTGASVLYMIVEKLENDQRLKQEFLLR